MSIASQSASQNQSHGITGFLSWKQGRFLQFLEGEEQAVRALYEKIAADPRHRVRRMLELSVWNDRLFPGWGLRFSTDKQTATIRSEDMIENAMRTMRAPVFVETEARSTIARMLEQIASNESARGAELAEAGSASASRPDRKTDAERQAEPRKQMLVVGFGASAGGLQPLQEIFKSLPRGLNAAFVVIQHFAPDTQSVMDTILGRETLMNIRKAEEGMRLRPGCVYLIPPGTDLEVDEGCFRLSDQERRNRGPQFPIDIFFRSLASSYGARAVAVVLSGTGSDGSRGIIDIDQHDGVVLVQDTESAEFDGMPIAAREAGVVQQVLKPYEIAEFIEELARNTSSDDTETDPVLRERAVKRVIEEMTIDDIDFTNYKVDTLYRRIDRRRLMAGVDSIGDYAALLASSEQERLRLRDDFLITVSSFFRDADAWERLASDAIPDIIESLDEDDVLRVWVAACATGEEAYTMAMVLTEAFDQLGREANFKVYASDIERNALDQASCGNYSEHAASRVSPERVERFFTPTADGFSIDRRLRERVIFAPHNFVQDSPFTRMHIVTCRNVLIYMQPELQQQALRTFHFSLKVGGVLFLGLSESLGALRNEFSPISREVNLYRKLREFRLPLHLDTRQLSTRRVRSIEPSPDSVSESRPLPDDLVTAMLARHLVQTIILVDANRDVVNVVSDELAVLELKRGGISRNVTELVPDDIAPSLAIALRSALKDREIARHVRLPCHRRNGGLIMLDCTVVPQTDEDAGRGLAGPRVAGQRATPSSAALDASSRQALVILAASPVQPDALDPSASSPIDGAEVRELELELESTRIALKDAIDEIESSDVGQRLANEQLTAANEELQSTNEELQSVNEELYTVNFEYQTKIHELSDLNHDLDNLLQSTHLGVVYLDADLCIRRYTDMASDVINLQPSDIGRPFSDLTHSLDFATLVAELERTVSLGMASDHTISTRDGLQELQVGIHPFRVGGNLASGALLTFLNITNLVQALD